MPRAPRTQSAGRASLVQSLGSKPITIGPPWPGYTPDVSPALLALEPTKSLIGIAMLSMSAPKRLVGLIPQNGYLTQDWGWRKAEEDGTTSFPLGDATVPGTGRPVMAVNWMQRHPNATTGTTTYHYQNFAITAGDGNPALVPGQLYIMDPLVDATWGDTSTPGTAVAWTGAAGDQMSAPPDNLTDYKFYPDKDTLIWCNGYGGDVVYRYPDGANATKYSKLPSTGIASFQAESVEIFNDRLMFLNTLEAGVSAPQRVRWAAVGQIDVDPSLVGAGSLDLHEFRQRGLRLLSMGTVCAAYFEDGVALLRNTQIATAPFQRQYATKLRGLIGKRAVCDLGGGNHFGIFTDGWFIFSQQGQWTERGIAEVQGIRVRKYLDTFYNSLRDDARTRVDICWHPILRLVRIAWSDNTSANGFPNRVWFYDPFGDRVFPDDYTDIGGLDLTPTCWGELRMPASVATKWSDMTAAWNSVIGSWSLYDPTFNVPTIAHGSQNGLVFSHEPGLIHRNDQDPTWYFQTHELDFGESYTYKTANLLRFEYLQIKGNDVTLFVGCDNNNRIQSKKLPVNVYGSIGSPQHERAHFSLSEHHLSCGFSGSGPLAMRELVFEVLPTMGDDVPAKV